MPAFAGIFADTVQLAHKDLGLQKSGTTALN
jgi:hypothetical protein